MSVHDYLCMVCYHAPAVHGVKARNLDPCVCCESPAALAAAAAIPCGRGICAAPEGHGGTCAEASGWADDALTDPVDADGLRAEASRLRADVARLRNRTYEIQAEEMAKRADLDRELARMRRDRQFAKQWTERANLRAEWATDSSLPFWGMTSEAARLCITDLIAERDAARADLDDLRAGIERLAAGWAATRAALPDTPADRAAGAELRACVRDLRALLGDQP